MGHAAYRRKAPDVYFPRKNKFEWIGVRRKKLWLPEVGSSKLFFRAFPAKIPVNRGMLPANREFHVVAGVVIFPTHPGLCESELGFARYGSANRGRRGVFGPFEDNFPIRIPVRPSKILAIREFHVVHGCVFFPTHPGSRINLLRVRKTLCASAATSVGKFRKFQHSLISSACFHARGRRSSRCRISTILDIVGKLALPTFQRYRPCTEASLGSQDMVLRTEAVGMFLMPRGHLLTEIPA
uniref:Uncharacterized protein n=1 Tax=Fagus sylvatica TaxID=28930 RepID=A0A2N9FL04_FAGSY